MHIIVWKSWKKKTFVQYFPKLRVVSTLSYQEVIIAKYTTEY